MLEGIRWAIVLADFIDLNPKKNLVWHVVVQKPFDTERSGTERKTIHRFQKTPLIDDSSVPDPWHFGVDPDPRIHASN